MPKAYKVEEMRIGDKAQANRIVFATLEDMEQAYKDLDNGKNILVQEPDGLVTKILHQMVSSRIYEATLLLSARPDEEKKDR